MGKYRIKVEFSTGDSFGSEDTSEIIELEWDDLSVAKENLKRISDHYKWYEEQNDYYSRHDKRKEKVPEPEWHVPLEYEFQIELLADNGNKMLIHAYWCGYFESLYTAEIITNEDELKITFNDYL